ncbi:pectate lyase family protein [Mangrovicoccus algicola]|uniref:Pectate lyase n=1 Tax=Mangrovicoccus algicola TaxID=2771008 RepID=A0A8J6ZA65_9RHOB|nr:pectate lyase [Mangrovicoccus algicola]MBE3639215.1 pectate lyase [Mangrovicoccus algicola]
MSRALIALLAGSTAFAAYAAEPLSEEVLALAAAPAATGWATVEGGTTGGAGAEPVIVTSRAELVAALGGDNLENAANAEAAVIVIDGVIDLTADDAGAPQDASAFAAEGYDEAAYIDAYSPEAWGRDKEPEGALEEAREASEQAQKAHSMIRVGSNKTLIGLPGAKIINGTLLLKGVENVIIRNIAFEDSWDFFPQWDPTDGSQGNWNAEYDLISIEDETRHVWIDHCSFSDGARHDDSIPQVFGRVHQHHDGLIDVKNGASLVTVSNSHFFDHDKTHIIGSSDSRTEDRGRLKVTLTGNWYDNVRQRLPRVRYGEVHVFGNLYTPTDSGPYAFDYALGAGKESQALSEANAFVLPEGMDPSKIIKHYKGERIEDRGSLVNGEAADLVALYNAANPDKTLEAGAGWEPPYEYELPDPAGLAEAIPASAGPTLLGDD